MNIKRAIIGGTGIGQLLAEISGEPIDIHTAFGTVSTKIINANSKEIAIFQRHQEGHKVPPHRVPYQAIATACKQIGVNICLSTAAVGSLHDDWDPGIYVVCKDFIDFSGRNITLFDNDVCHCDMSDPFPARTSLVRTLELHNTEYKTGTYVNVNGPRYETSTEIRAFAQLGGDVVGMTVGSEAIVMAESEIKYGCIAIITNHGTGLNDSKVSHGKVGEVMKECGPIALNILLEAINLET